MTPAAPQYDSRYLAGIVLFNRGAYFDAHEVWEGLWRDCPGDQRRFYQGLIQAAVAIYHAGNGNAAGAGRLLRSGRSYMLAYPSPHLGLDVPAFWRDVERYLKHLLEGAGPTGAGEPAPAIAPDPPPGGWPDPDCFLVGDGPADPGGTA